MKRLVQEARKAGADEVIVASNSSIRDARTVPAGKNRSEDYNSAAKAAKGDVLVFIQRKTVKFPRDLFRKMRITVEGGAVGGGVNIKFDKTHWMLSIVAFFSNYYRMRIRKIIYCDQTMFVRTSVFRKMKGFKKIPLFGDSDFSARLRKQGKLAFLKGPVVTGADRFVANGIFRHTLRNQVLKLLYNIGISPNKIKRIYEARM